MALPRPVLRRVALLATSGVVAELLLRLVVYVGPAFRALARPLYWIIAGVTTIAVVHALRPRRTQDRRHAERRHPSAEDKA